jgi:2-iminoacetate synthase
MDLAKPGLIQKFCRTNAILTYKEYLEDYASPETKAVGDALIGRLLAETKGARLRENIEKRLRKIEEGQRDLYV